MKRLMILGACLPLVAMAAADSGGGSGQKPLTLEEAIGALKYDREEDWTQGGEPAMARIEELTGNPDLKRADVRKAAPEGFNRETLKGADDGKVSEAGSDASATQVQPPANDLGEQSGATGNEEAAGVPLTGVAATVGAILNNSFDGSAFNPVILMEAVVTAAQDDRYRRNNALQTLVRGYQVSQAEIKDVQSRLDARRDDRAEKNRKARAETKARERAEKAG